MTETSPSRRRQIQQPSVAEIVADILRERIVSGQLKAGQSLPKQEDLIREFNVSRQSLRESLRLLESEGLISIRRGNVGGAIVHPPDAGHATYLLGLVLQLEQVPIQDLAVAIRHVEPLCAAMCARREDRSEAVVPSLQARIDRAEALIDDPEAFTTESRAFHTDLVRLSGNRTLEMVVGVLANLWSIQEAQWAHEAVEEDEYPSRDQRVASIEEHRRILHYIADGAADEVAKLFENHVAAVQHFVMRGRGSVQVRVTAQRRNGLLR